MLGFVRLVENASSSNFGFTCTFRFIVKHEHGTWKWEGPFARRKKDVCLDLFIFLSLFPFFDLIVAEIYSNTERRKTVHGLLHIPLEECCLTTKSKRERSDKEGKMWGWEGEDI